MPEHTPVLPGPGVQKAKSPKTSSQIICNSSSHGSTHREFPYQIVLGKLLTYTLSFSSLLPPSRKFPPVPLSEGCMEPICSLSWRSTLICFLTASVQQEVQMSTQSQELLSGGQTSIFYKLMVSFMLLTIAKIIKNGRIHISFRLYFSLFILFCLIYDFQRWRPVFPKASLESGTKFPVGRGSALFITWLMHFTWDSCFCIQGLCVHCGGKMLLYAGITKNFQSWIKITLSYDFSFDLREASL